MLLDKRQLGAESPFDGALGRRHRSYLGHVCLRAESTEESCVRTRETVSGGERPSQPFVT